MASEESMMTSSSSIPDDDTDPPGFHPYGQSKQNSLSRLSICKSSFNEDDEDQHPYDGDVSDSDMESSGFYTLPTITSHRRIKLGSEESSSTCNLLNQRKVSRERSKRGNQYGHRTNDVERDGNRYDGGGGGEFTVLTRVRGGKKSMKMGFEEVKACRDLGFDVEVPGRVLLSTGSNCESQTSSNSPITNWGISRPGDDPKEVKARLKMWAQAVALASASR